MHFLVNWVTSMLRYIQYVYGDKTLN